MGKDSRQQDPLAELGFQSYAEYLASPHWQALKGRLLRGRSCEVCQEQSARVPHHLNYWRLGHEKACDFLLVCVNCHEKIHRELDQRYPRASTWWKVERTVKTLHSMGYKVLDPTRTPTPEEDNPRRRPRKRKRRNHHQGENGRGHYEPGKRGKRYSYREAVERAGLTWQDTPIQKRPL